MDFTLDGRAQGAQAAGAGMGNAIKAIFGAPYARQSAEQDTALALARTYHSNMAGNKAGVEAEQKRSALAIQNDPLENTMLSFGLPTSLAPAFRERITTGSFGPSYQTPSDGVGPVMQAPANDETIKKLMQQMSLTQRTFATGSNIDQGAGAALKEQKARGIDAVIANPALAGTYGKANAAAEGRPLFNHVGNTGYSMDNFTGSQIAGNSRLIAENEGAGGNIKLNENQGNALIYGARARQAAANLESLYGDYSPTGVNAKIYAENIPVVGGALGAGINMVTTSNNQKAEQAQRNFINAIMRRESGATIQKPEFDNANLQYFPQSGDSQEVLAQKKANRDIAIDALRIIAGPGRKKVDELSDKAIEAGNTPSVDRLDILRQAKDAVARGADRKKVVAELRSKYGIQSAGF